MPVRDIANIPLSTYKNLSVISSPGKIMFIYEGTNNLVSGAFLKCFSISTQVDLSLPFAHVILVNFSRCGFLNK